MAKGKNIKNKVNKNVNKRSSIITISILIFIGLVAFISIFYQVAINDSKIGYVSLKPVDVTISSGEESHKISVKVTLGGKSKNLNKLNMENVQLVVKETIKSLDYNNIVGEDGNEYIKNVVLTAIRQEFGNDIEQVSLDELLTDVTVNIPGEQVIQNPTPSVDEILENFGWTKKK